MEPADSTATKGKCGCPCHALPAVFVVALGVTFLLRALDVLSNHAAGIIWPIIVILAGLQMLFGRMCKCCATK